MQSLAWVMLAVAFVTASGCGPGAEPQKMGLASDTNSAEVTVENQTPSTVRIFAMYGGDESFLGRVQPLGRAEFLLPGAAGSSVRLVARPSVDMGRDSRHVSEPIQVPPGGSVAWRLLASPGASSLPRISTVRLLACSGDWSC